MIYNRNGEFLQLDQTGLPPNDGAILFGDTLFETLKAKKGRICFLDDHLDRLRLSARLLGFPVDSERMRSALQATAVRLTAPVARLRLTVSRGSFDGLDFPSSGNSHFFIIAAPYREPDQKEREQGAVCIFAPNQRVNPLSHLPQMKRGNYADCLYAVNHARQKGAREALFRTRDHQLLEGATSNLFILRKGQLLTPPAGELVLAGVLRRRILQAAESLGLPAKERPVTVEELFSADEAFLTNALIETLPIAMVEGRPLRRGSWSERLRKAINQPD